MKWKLFFLAVTLLVLGSCTAAQKRNKRWVWPDSIDIDTKTDDTELETGSGNGGFDTDDEDLIDHVEGSSDDDIGEESGSGIISTPGISPGDTTRLTPPLTACQRLRSSVIENLPVHLSSENYIPKCTDTGEFARLQCNGRSHSGLCWCVNRKGEEISGTRMKGPETPDCKTGANIKPCAYQLLKSHYKIIGVIRPRCTIDGEYEPIQCFQGECWCVDENGVEKENTRRIGGGLKCDETTTESVVTTTMLPTTKAPKPDKTEDVADSTDDVFSIDGTDGFTPAPEEDKTEKPDIHLDHTLKFPETESPDTENRPNQYDTNKGDLSDSETTFKQFVNRPFILGAIIAGAVVGLLGAILLVMFIVYRMRKKDEGSYALEEEKFTNYSYMKAPDKEFYA